MAILIDGRATAEKLRGQIAEEVAGLKARGLAPGLAVALVGDDPASQVYVRNKKKACADAGIESVEVLLPGDTSRETLLDTVRELNARADVHGILVQFPLPGHLSERDVIETIAQEKDVDCFHPVNVGKIMTGEMGGFLPCTPAGVMVLLEEYGVPLRGKHCVIVGRSNLVGKPLSLLMLAKDATVTLCHSKTADLGAVTRQADVLVAAVGRPGLITADMVKPGAVVVDVGTTRLESGKLSGDVRFDEVSEVASLITPVPGGVGPMTITALLQNTVRAAKNTLKD